MTIPYEWFAQRLLAPARLRIRSGASLLIEGAVLGGQPATTYFVDTVVGSDAGDGQSWATAKATMAAALALVADNAEVYVTGDVREQIVAPLGVTGVKIIGASGGRNRHDNGTRWREAAVAAGLPLIRIREQGWEFHHILFVPETGFSAIRAHRAEDATNPDSSHFIVRDCKFIGNVAFGSAGGIGIEDFGGNHHYLVQDCEFMQLVSAIAMTNVSIAAPLRDVIRDNRFEGNTNDITMNASRCLIQGNVFMTPFNGVTHPNTINVAFTADPATGNFVIDNTFADAAADVTIAKGYKPSTSDVWRNRVTNTAADIVTVPA